MAGLIYYGLRATPADKVLPEDELWPSGGRFTLAYQALRGNVFSSDRPTSLGAVG